MLPVSERSFMFGEDADPSATKKEARKAAPAGKDDTKDAKAKAKAKKAAVRAVPKPVPGSEAAWNAQVKACEKDLRAKGCPAAHCSNLKKYPTFAERAVCTDDASRWKPPPCKFSTALYIRMVRTNAVPVALPHAAEHHSFNSIQSEIPALLPRHTTQSPAAVPSEATHLLPDCNTHTQANMDLDPVFALKSFEKRSAIKMKILVKAVESHKAAADLNKNGKIEPKELKHLIMKLSPMINDNSQLGKCTYTKGAAALGLWRR